MSGGGSDPTGNPGWPGPPPQHPSWPGHPGPSGPMWPTDPSGPERPPGPSGPGWPPGPSGPGWPPGPSGPGWPLGPSGPGWPPGPSGPERPPGPSGPGWPPGLSGPERPPGPSGPGWPPGPSGPGGGGALPNAPSHPSAPGSDLTPLTVPYNRPLPDGLRDKVLITICGSVKPNADKITVDLCAGTDIAFHFNPRFNEYGQKVIVRNTRIKNQWGKEERPLQNFPFGPGKPFEIKILCTNSEYKVAVNNSHLLEYKHRIPNLKSINALKIYNDVDLTKVDIEMLH